MKPARLTLYVTVSIFVTYVSGKEITIHCDDVPGYYWRDYTGEVPSDAVPGGTDYKGKATYIGQTVHPGASLLPGLINESVRKMFYEFGGVEQASVEDVKILCSQNSTQLQWISTKSGESVTGLGNDIHLILGGHDRSRPLGIGRKAIPTGEVQVAKVVIADNKFHSIYLAHDGVGWSDSGPYEILVYNNASDSMKVPNGHIQNGYIQNVYNIHFN